MSFESTRYVDLVVPENCWEQKTTDAHDYDTVTFVMRDDWNSKLDFLTEEGINVVYLARTPEIRATLIKEDFIKLHTVRV